MAGSGHPGGWNFACVKRATFDELAYVRIGDRAFVVGLQAVPDVVEQPVHLVDGSELPVLYVGWTGPVIREVPTGARVTDRGRPVPRLPDQRLADAVGFDAVVLQVVECVPDRAIVRSVTGSVHSVDAEMLVERGDDGDWLDPFPEPSVYLGGGRWANELPDEFRRPGDSPRRTVHHGRRRRRFTCGTHRRDRVRATRHRFSIGYTRDGTEPSWPNPDTG